MTAQHKRRGVTPFHTWMPRFAPVDPSLPGGGPIPATGPDRYPDVFPRRFCRPASEHFTPEPVELLVRMDAWSGAVLGFPSLEMATPITNIGDGSS